jgi:Protein of unknown function (DUF1566)
VAAVNALRLCGFSDWRLPTSNELLSIVDYGVPYLWYGPPLPASINATWFPNTVDAVYWTETPFFTNATYVWSVQFGGGYTDSGGGNGNRSLPGRIRLVHGAQTVRHYSVVSVVYPGDAAGNAVHDSQTGVVWRRCAEGQAWTGQTCGGVARGVSHDTAMALAKAVPGAWRLPNIRELGTLASRGLILENNTLDPVAFPNAAYGYWASTPWVGSGGYGALLLAARDGGGVGPGSRAYEYSAILVYNP